MKYEDTPVLIVEDRVENRQAATEFFSTINIPVVFATNFNQAKELLETKRVFRTCIMDVEIPLNEGDVPEQHHHELQKICDRTHNSTYIFATGGPGHGFDGCYISILPGVLDNPNFGQFTDHHYGSFHSQNKSYSNTWEKIWNETVRIHEDGMEILAQTKIDIGWS